LPHRPILTFDDKARAAYDVQIECEAAMEHLALWSKKITKMDNLCISGGVALNSVSNYKLLKLGIYKDIFINPAASDTGIPLGAALHGLHHVKKVKKNYDVISPYLGPTYSNTLIESTIKNFSGFKIVRKNALKVAASMLASNKILGCHNGRSEMGPRALGNRSILMSPLLSENKDTLNLLVKHRESFRPFAPVILEEFVSEYFKIDRSCPYMLFVPEVKESKRSIIPAVTHVDGSARLQTISKEQNTVLHELISEFHILTGVPVILNTSFNDNNEPIVETLSDAIQCFLNTNIDALIINGKIILIKDFS
jgi:carbamoyltransferase